MRLLVIEDEIKIARVIAAALKRERHAVDIEHDGEAGLQMALSQPYDLLVIDRMLPNIEGTEIVKEIRKNNKLMPILLLTALGTTEDKAYGLDSGADDYLVKPFAVDELLARVRALLRRPPIQQPDILKISDLTIDTTQQLVRRNGTLIELTAKEYALLEYLARHPNQVLSKETLIDHVWDFDANILPNNVEAYIKNLRRKIDKPFKKPLIQTVRGFGYKLEVEA